MPELPAGAPPNPVTPIGEIAKWEFRISCGKCRRKVMVRAATVIEREGPHLPIYRVVDRFRCNCWGYDRAVRWSSAIGVAGRSLVRREVGSHRPSVGGIAQRIELSGGRNRRMCNLYYADQTTLRNLFNVDVDDFGTSQSQAGVFPDCR
jgi:hypothetical protein